MSYIQQNLTQDESIIKTANISWWSHVPYMLVEFFIVMFIVGFSFFGAVILLLIFIAGHVFGIKSAELAFTNKRVIAKFGLISRHTVDLRLSKVESIGFEQGIFGRIFGYGSIIINGAGNATPIPSISKPEEFKKALDSYLNDIH